MFYQIALSCLLVLFAIGHVYGGPLVQSDDIGGWLGYGSYYQKNEQFQLGDSFYKFYGETLLSDEQLVPIRQPIQDELDQPFEVTDLLEGSGMADTNIKIVANIDDLPETLEGSGADNTGSPISFTTTDLPLSSLTASETRSVSSSISGCVPYADPLQGCHAVPDDCGYWNGTKWSTEPYCKYFLSDPNYIRMVCSGKSNLIVSKVCEHCGVTCPMLDPIQDLMNALRRR